MKQRPKLIRGADGTSFFKNSQYIHIFQHRIGYSGVCPCIGMIKRRVHKKIAIFPERIECSDQPLRPRKFFWITLHNKQKWAVRFEENRLNKFWVIEGWYVTLPANIDVSKLNFIY